MLKTLVITAIGLLAFSANAQQGFTIKGKLTGVKNGQKVMLSYRTGEKEVNDSAIVRNGSFLLKGKVKDVTKAKITLKDPKADKEPMTMEKMMAMDEQDFFLENKAFSVAGSNMKTALIKGGAAQADYLVLKSQLKPLEDKMKPLSEKMGQYFKENNEKAKDELFPKLRAIRVDMTKVEDGFIYQHPDSYVSLDLVESKSGVIDPKRFEPFFKALSPRIQNSVKGKDLAARLKTAKKIDIGQPAMDFVQNNTKGVPVSLSSLKGKYVLIDFWASWCGPCRQENPNVLKVYQKFKDKNFEIIAVSLDNKKEAWLKAIAADGLPWIHVSDLKGWKNAVAADYDVKAVPQNFLVGPDGKILAKNLIGKELEEELGRLIK
ncbi:TlpA disulfide reductase family protein [Pedobacter hiemivivus]|uniref:AhpC/TSA family protein n=1 Tax=Pedobacter hiemivivus TaxID=2530454 RepID=A0A4R0NJY2_9SPHI|nr:TlpA disulfide reductase family protein [Pedobacter hiemivivus]TCC99623.1 AhpC/TSA family protein [Pedobacter hiemivivus]